MIKPYRQHRLEIRAQAAYELLILLIKWAGLLAFLLFWTEVPYVS